jgi:hypothetical protein
MKQYIETKFIQAEPATRRECCKVQNVLTSTAGLPEVKTDA